MVKLKRKHIENFRFNLENYLNSFEASKEEKYKIKSSLLGFLTFLDTNKNKINKVIKKINKEKLSYHFTNPGRHY